MKIILRPTALVLRPGEVLSLQLEEMWMCLWEMHQMILRIWFRKAEKVVLDTVFGNLFTEGGVVFDYPWIKLILNRMKNWLVALMFAVRNSDTTNAFKLNRR